MQTADVVLLIVYTEVDILNIYFFSFCMDHVTLFLLGFRCFFTESNPFVCVWTLESSSCRKKNFFIL